MIGELAYMNKHKIAIIVKIVYYTVSICFVSYFSSYFLMSVFGTYQPGVVDLTGIKSYQWSPWGFYDPNHPSKNSIAARRSGTTKFGGWNATMLRIYYPLYMLDIMYLHRSKEGVTH